MSKRLIPIVPAKISTVSGKLVNNHSNTDYSTITVEKLVESFIHGNNLINRWKELENQFFVIGESGFESGLSFLVTWQLWQQYAPEKAHLYYISNEIHPLTKDDLTQVLQSWPDLIHIHDLLDNYPILTPGFHYLSFNQVTLILTLGKPEACWTELIVSGDKNLESLVRDYWIDAWFIHHKEYSPRLLELINSLSKPETTLVSTLTHQKYLTDLCQSGFKQLSNANKEKEYIIAHYKESVVNTLKHRKTPWHLGVTKVSDKKAIVIGAGLAGCYSAYALANRGWQVCLLDAATEVAQGASGNQQAILYPKLSAFYSPLLNYLLMGFLYANRIYKKILADQSLGELKGLLQLSYSPKEAINHKALESWLLHYPELGYFTKANRLLKETEFNLNTKALFIPKAGWMNMPALCQWLIQSPQITFYQTSVEQLNYHNAVWHINDHRATTVILANGYQANQWQQTEQLPLKAIRGQTSSISTIAAIENLSIPICAKGHLLPQYQGLHSIGATYHLNDIQVKTTIEDDKINLNYLAGLAPAIDWPEKSSLSWSGIRAATPDYLPLLGPVPIIEDFSTAFQTLKLDANRWINRTGVYYPGLYIISGFGSRGLTTIPLSAEWLASVINQEPSCLPTSMIQAVSPARFLIKKIIKEH